MLEIKCVLDIFTTEFLPSKESSGAGLTGGLAVQD